MPHVDHPRPFVGVFQKSILDRFVNFWRLFPAKWLQNRPQIPEPSSGITPRRAFCGGFLAHKRTPIPLGSPAAERSCPQNITRVPRYRVTSLQGSLATGVPRYRGTSLQGYLAYEKTPIPLGPL